MLSNLFTYCVISIVSGKITPFCSVIFLSVVQCFQINIKNNVCFILLQQTFFFEGFRTFLMALSFMSLTQCNLSSEV